MHNSHLRTQPRYSNVGKLVMTLVFTVVISGLAMVPAFGQGYGRHPENAERHEYWRERHEEHRERWRERHEERRWRERHEERRWRAHQPYGYAAPLYTPPPVVYAPAPSPGINLFFHIR